MNINLTNNKKSQALSSGTILLFMLASTTLTQAAFQARAAAHALRHGTRSLVPTVQRQFSTHNLPTKTFSHRAQDQRHWLRTVLLPATVATLFMASHRERSHCTRLSYHIEQRQRELRLRHEKQSEPTDRPAITERQRNTLKQILLEAVEREDYATVHKLVTTFDPESALRSAVEENEYMIVYRLLEEHVSVQNFRTLFLKKIVENTEEGNKIAQLLLSKNTELAHIVDKNHNTPLDIAVIHKNEALVEALIAAGAEVNVGLRGGITPLHRAVVPGGEVCACLLLDNGANVNLRTRDGLTPLMIAVQKWGNIENVKLLVDHGAEFYHTTRWCCEDMSVPAFGVCKWKDATALDIARSEGDGEIVAFLKEVYKKDRE